MKPSKLSGCLGPLLCKELTRQSEREQEIFCMGKGVSSALMPNGKGRKEQDHV